jgi:hypothetical protein
MSDNNDVPGRLGDASQDQTNLDGGPDLDTVRQNQRRIVDEADGNPSPDAPSRSPRTSDERSGAPTPTTPPTPTGDDPFVPGAAEDSEGNNSESEDAAPKTIRDKEGPSYERDQGTNDDNVGGSTDPNNSLSHSDSGKVD